MELWESGLVRFWVDNIPSTPKAQKCFADTKRQVTRLVPIRLSDLISAFFILGIGIGLATLCFLLELIISNFHRIRRGQ
jgi:ionotropic glutamate receptor